MAAANNVFAWQGIDKSGKKTKGEISSKSATVAKVELRKKGINPTKVTKKGGLLAGLLSAGQKITPADIALFTRQLATMMKAGVPLVQSFEIVADGMDNASMKALILESETTFPPVIPLPPLSKQIQNTLTIFFVTLLMQVSNLAHLKPCLIDWRPIRKKQKH